MPSRPSATDSTYQQEAADGGYFAALAPARYMLLTTFKRDGAPVSAPVQGVTVGRRAYFRAWSQSGTLKRLRHTDAVQVTPCTVLGLCSFGPPINATARLVRGETASRVAGKLARKYPDRHRFLIPLLYRTWRRQMVLYELLAHDAADRGAELRVKPALSIPPPSPLRCTFTPPDHTQR
jgi:PPOX class probable F420-dependent enzyme